MKTIAHALNNHALQKKAFFVLAIVVFLLFATYIYFVNQTVWNVVARQDAVKVVRQLSSDVASLEASYMSFSSTITLEHAYVMGFQDVQSENTLFIERQVPAIAIAR